MYICRAYTCARTAVPERPNRVRGHPVSKDLTLNSCFLLYVACRQYGNIKGNIKEMRALLTCTSPAQRTYLLCAPHICTYRTSHLLHTTQLTPSQPAANPTPPLAHDLSTINSPPTWPRPHLSSPSLLTPNLSHPHFSPTSSQATGNQTCHHSQREKI